MLAPPRAMEPVQLTLTTDEVNFLAAHLARHIASMETELAHTDKRELQHALAEDVRKLRAIAAHFPASGK